MGKLTARRGDTTTITVVYTLNGVAVDLTDATVFFTVKPTLPTDDSDDSAAIITETVTSHSDPTAGTTIIELSAAQMTVNAGNYHYDIQVKDSDDNITTIDVGTFKVLPDVTRRTS